MYSINKLINSNFLYFFFGIFLSLISCSLNNKKNANKEDLQKAILRCLSENGYNANNENIKTLEEFYYFYDLDKKNNKIESYDEKYSDSLFKYIDEYHNSEYFNKFIKDLKNLINKNNQTGSIQKINETIDFIYVTSLDEKNIKFGIHQEHLQKEISNFLLKYKKDNDIKQKNQSDISTLISEYTLKKGFCGGFVALTIFKILNSQSSDGDEIIINNKKYKKKNILKGYALMEDYFNKKKFLDKPDELYNYLSSDQKQYMIDFISALLNFLEVNNFAKGDKKKLCKTLGLSEILKSTQYVYDKKMLKKYLENIFKDFKDKEFFITIDRYKWQDDWHAMMIHSKKNKTTFYDSLSTEEYKTELLTVSNNLINDLVEIIWDKTPSFRWRDEKDFEKYNLTIDKIYREVRISVLVKDPTNIDTESYNFSWKEIYKSIIENKKIFKWKKYNKNKDKTLEYLINNTEPTFIDSDKTYTNQNFFLFNYYNNKWPKNANIITYD